MRDIVRALCAGTLAAAIVVAFIASTSDTEAAGPVPEMQAGQTYEVWWNCDQTGCAVELATIVHVDKKRGYVLDSRGFWFKPDNAMAFRDARNVPASAPKDDNHLPQIRAGR